MTALSAIYLQYSITKFLQVNVCLPPPRQPALSAIFWHPPALSALFCVYLRQKYFSISPIPLLLGVPVVECLQFGFSNYPITNLLVLSAIYQFFLGLYESVTLAGGRTI
jgi:hypothetical protein